MSAGKKRNTKLWRIWSMYLKEVRLIRNDVYALLLIFCLPAMIMGTMWVANNQDEFTSAGDDGKNSDALTIGVVDVDPTDTFPGEDLSQNFTWYLSQSPDFITVIYADEDEALDALYFDVIDAYAVIGYGFEGNITGDIPAIVDVHISSTEFMSQAAIFSAFFDVVADFRNDHGWIEREVLTVTVREFEPVGDYSAATFGVFLLVFGIFIGVSSTAAQAIVGDIPLNRMLLTPASKMEAILAKTLGYFSVGMVQAVLLLYLWKFMFGVVPNTDDFTILAILGLMSLSGAALGVLISTFCKTRLQANQSFLFLLFGSFLVGTGFIDVGIVDDIWPLNIGRIMVFDTSFKGVALGTFLWEIELILIITLAFIIMAWLVFISRKTLA